MTLEQAIYIVSQLIALAPVNLQSHQQGQEALTVLKKVIESKKLENKDVK